MIGLLQRVAHARVEIAGEAVAGINIGLLVLVGVERQDDIGDANRLAERILSYRVFPDIDKRMNLSVMDVAGGVLLVPQFTLAADTRKGTRASFACAAAPERACELFDELVATVAARHNPVASGRFGADMQVALVNDGPVTFALRTRHDSNMIRNCDN